MEKRVPKSPLFCGELGLLLKFPLEKTKLQKKERDISTMTPKTHEKLQVLGTPPPKKKSLDTLFFHIYFSTLSFLFIPIMYLIQKNLSPAVSSFCRMELHKPPTLCFHITHRNLLFVRCFQELHIWPAKLIAACLVFFGDADLSIYSFAQKKRLSAKKTKGESSILQGKSHKKTQRSDFKKVERGNCPTDLF